MIKVYTAPIAKDLSDILNEHQIDLADILSLEDKPTYADVIDGLHSEYNISIEFAPVCTYATIDHTGYYYKIYKFNDETGGFDLIHDENMWMATLGFAMKDIVKLLIDKKII